MHRFLLPLLALLLAVGCADDEFPLDTPSTRLSFPAEGLTFDTVFTAMGSTTRQVVVYNHTGEDLRLSEVRLVHGRESRFRLNVDGDTALVATNIEVAAHDSIFIFVQANINPTDATAPFLITDSVRFSNGQYLPLSAYGRNAYYHRRPDTAQSTLYRLDCTAWNTHQHDRPHIILGNAVVPEGETLRLTAGDELYFGPGAMLIVDSTARLEIEGTSEQPVLLTSVRHDGWYDYLPGQWQMLWFYTGSTGRISHALIENAVGGIRLYPTASLDISHTEVRHNSDAALVAQDATVTGNNLLLHTSLAAMMLIGGGDYTFSQCTFAGYWPYSSRDTAAVVLSNYYPLSAEAIYADDMRRADFSRCIIYGNRQRGELSLNAVEGVDMNYSFTQCLIRGGDWDEDPLFADPASGDFHLQENSPAEGIGYSYEL